MQKEVFEKLFEGYLQNTLSELDQQQLMKAINEGKYDDLIKEKIDFSLYEDEALSEIEPEKADFILHDILSAPLMLSKVIPMAGKRKKNVRLILAAAAIIGILAAGTTFFFRSNETSIPVLEQKDPQGDYDMMAFSGKQLIHLPDGSTILLNANSSISYRQNDFNLNTREVTLTGEAFFDIKRNKTKPFIVHTGKVSTKVLGTAFNIKAGNSTENIEVTVIRGKVQVGDGKKIYGTIIPNQQIRVNKNTLSYQHKIVSAETVTQWKNKYLILDDINMEEAAALISDKYKVQILLSNEKIKKCRITASFVNDEDLDHVLKVICSVIETQYHYNKTGSVVLQGDGCQ
ncbi:FecR family protein [Flavobacterium sp. FlaQc-47]|uniref:FecR family protein n=1 Tax=Flavobacterium sp. FlaQc-47 TaxID=3374180 RepID=UPI00375766A5